MRSPGICLGTAHHFLGDAQPFMFPFHRFDGFGEGLLGVLPRGGGGGHRSGERFQRRFDSDEAGVCGCLLHGECPLGAAGGYWRLSLSSICIIRSSSVRSRTVADSSSAA